ncbi:hypothetical protein C8F01DRAFT_624772 [Mycena amicta]|nr:hypothetical protein C8F01DRAFT_624772 [Mycena amicta]
MTLGGFSFDVPAGLPPVLTDDSEVCLWRWHGDTGAECGRAVRRGQIVVQPQPLPSVDALPARRPLWHNPPLPHTTGTSAESPPTTRNANLLYSEQLRKLAALRLGNAPLLDIPPTTVILSLSFSVVDWFRVTAQPSEGTHSPDPVRFHAPGNTVVYSSPTLAAARTRSSFGPTASPYLDRPTYVSPIPSAVVVHRYAETSSAGRHSKSLRIVAVSDSETPRGTKRQRRIPACRQRRPWKTSAKGLLAARVNGHDRAPSAWSVPSDSAVVDRFSGAFRFLPHDLLLPRHSPAHLLLRLSMPLSHPRPSRSESSVPSPDYSIFSRDHDHDLFPVARHRRPIPWSSFRKRVVSVQTSVLHLRGFFFVLRRGAGEGGICSSSSNASIFQVVFQRLSDNDLAFAMGTSYAYLDGHPCPLPW